MQVDEEAGLDTQPASSGDVAGCDEVLFTEEAREELLSESLSECVSSVSRSGGSGTSSLGDSSGQGNLTVEFRFWSRSNCLGGWSSPRRRGSV